MGHPTKKTSTAAAAATPPLPLLPHPRRLPFLRCPLLVLVLVLVPELVLVLVAQEAPVSSKLQLLVQPCVQLFL